MKMINDLRKQLESIGATLDPNTDYTLKCDAPSGYVWRANGTTCLSIHYATNRQTWLAEELRRELPNLKMGLEKVTDEEQLTEHRWNLGEDSWGAPADAPDRIEWPNDTVDKMPGLRKLLVQHPQATRP